jgi:hypothetical protein
MSRFFPCKPGFVYGTGGGGKSVFPEDGECFPQGEGFEGQDDVCACALTYVFYQRQVPAEQRFFHDVARGGDSVHSVLTGYFMPD